MEIGGKSRGEDPETSGVGVWEGQKDRDCGRSQVDQGGKVSREEVRRKGIKERAGKEGERRREEGKQ